MGWVIFVCIERDNTRAWALFDMFINCSHFLFFDMLVLILCQFFNWEISPIYKFKLGTILGNCCMLTFSFLGDWGGYAWWCSLTDSMGMEDKLRRTTPLCSQTMLNSDFSGWGDAYLILFLYIYLGIYGPIHMHTLASAYRKGRNYIHGTTESFFCLIKGEEKPGSRTDSKSQTCHLKWYVILHNI